MGYTLIDLFSKDPVSSVILNFADLTFNSCILLSAKDKKDLKLTLDHNEEEVHIDLPNAITGEFQIEFKYQGKIKDNLKGLYQTQYKVGNELHTGAVTQFQTEDARRMFPCFDEPGMKATFDLEIIVDKNYSTISNTPIKSEKEIQNNKKHVVFETTPKMSTYLLFLGIAEFETIEDKLGPIIVRVINHPGLSQYGEFALAFGLKSLDYCQKYFNIPYPLPKLDLISTPAFAAGAMRIGELYSLDRTIF